MLCGCTRKKPHTNLVEYIKAEKALRSRIGQEPWIEDSVRALSKRYGLDLNKTLAELADEPEVWLEVLQELKNGK
ncbi:MAG: hypothetical protein WBB67_06955 [bacterium]